MLEASQVAEVERAIQLAIAPAFLLTAIATFINVLVARLARTVDRERALRAGADPAMPDERPVLARRAWLTYRAIAWCVLAATLICILIVMSFVGVFLGIGLAWVVGGLLIAAMLSAILALGCFLGEIRLAAHHLPPPDGS